jgi:hypothetical protein
VYLLLHAVDPVGRSAIIGEPRPSMLSVTLKGTASTSAATPAANGRRDASQAPKRAASADEVEHVRLKIILHRGHIRLLNCTKGPSRSPGNIWSERANLDNGAAASRFVSDTIEIMIRHS